MTGMREDVEYLYIKETNLVRRVLVILMSYPSQWDMSVSCKSYLSMK